MLLWCVRGMFLDLKFFYLRVRRAEAGGTPTRPRPLPDVTEHATSRGG